jgi:hypothetical protein
MVAIIPILTNEGANALFNANNNGLQAVVSHIAVGTGVYTPLAGRTALQAETQRVTVAQAQKIDDFTRQMEALFDGPAAYTVREVGIFLNTGVLLAVWSSLTQTLSFKNANTELLISLQLRIADAPPNSWTVAAPDASLTVAENLVANAGAIANIFLLNLKLEKRITDLEG